MKPGAALVAMAAAVFVAGNAWPQGAGTPGGGGVTVPPGVLTPQGLLSGSDLGAYSSTYRGLHTFWGDDAISRFFHHAANGTLADVRPLVAELCDKWRHRDPHLPVTGIIDVPPGIELDLTRLCS